jgi:hypothetical protein
VDVLAYLPQQVINSRISKTRGRRRGRRKRDIILKPVKNMRRRIGQTLGRTRPAAVPPTPISLSTQPKQISSTPQFLQAPLTGTRDKEGTWI